MKTVKQLNLGTASLVVSTLISCLAISANGQTMMKLDQPKLTKSVEQAAKSANATKMTEVQKPIFTAKQSTKKKGTNSSGGGNEKEGDFISFARMIYDQLYTNSSSANQILGIDIAVYAEAIDSTAVHCAVGDVLQIMRDFRKTAYYLSSSESIHLDCDNYFEAKKSGELGFITTFHEYMRAANLESDEYLVSSKLGRAFAVLGLPAPDSIDMGIRKCFEKNAEVDPFAHSEIATQLGRQRAACLKDEGFVKQSTGVNAKGEPIYHTSGTIIESLGYATDIKKFVSVVTKYLRRL